MKNGETSDISDFRLDLNQNLNQKSSMYWYNRLPLY